MNLFPSKSVLQSGTDLPSDTDLIDYVDKFVKQLIIDGTTDDGKFNCAMCEAIQYIIDKCPFYKTYYIYYKSLKYDNTNKGLLTFLVPTFCQATPKIGTTMIEETSNDYPKVFNMIIKTYKTVSKTKIAPSKFDPNNTGEVELSTHDNQGIPAGGRKRSRRDRKSKKSRRTKKNRRSCKKSKKY